MLRYEIGEIEAAGITAGEWERLRSDAAKYEHAETIATAVGTRSRAFGRTTVPRSA